MFYYQLAALRVVTFFNPLIAPHDYELGIILAPLKTNYSTQFAANVMETRESECVKNVSAWSYMP